MYKLLKLLFSADALVRASAKRMQYYEKFL